MVSTLEALLVALVALLPGAAYTWAFEQQTGRWGANSSDRVWRFAGTSALFVALSLPIFYWAYQDLVLTERLRQGREVPWWVWLIPPAYVAAPWFLGRSTGQAVRRRARWVSFLAGPAPSPRAWDHLFTTPDLNGWLLLRMKDDTWIAGFWGAEEQEGSAILRSYASGYPEVQDLFFAETATVSAEGEVVVDDDGFPVPAGMGVLVRWDEVAYAYFTEG